MIPDATTLVLGRGDVAALLDPVACIEVVERAFDRQGRGDADPPQSIGFHVPAGTFHVKAALLDLDRPHFVAKLNGNFPGNPDAHGLPTIQGVLVLFDARDGRPLAIMDSGEITARRTAAASAVAAKHLARRDSSRLAILGCGRQAHAHLRALACVLELRHVSVYDLDAGRAEAFAREHESFAGASVTAVRNRAAAARASDILVTLTGGGAWVLGPEDVAPGSFVAAVGADNPRKREIEPALMRRARVVVDDLEQCARDGDLHHAIDAGVMTRADVHADLASVVAGVAPARTSDDEIFLFDSTGIALEDVAAAALVYRLACERTRGLAVSLSS